MKTYMVRRGLMATSIVILVVTMMVWAAQRRGGGHSHASLASPLPVPALPTTVVPSLSPPCACNHQLPLHTANMSLPTPYHSSVTADLGVGDLEALASMSGSARLVAQTAAAMSGATFHHHYHILYDLRTLLGPAPARYMEIGSYCGGSLALMMQHPFPTSFVSIDPLIARPNQKQTFDANIATFNVRGQQHEHHQRFSTDPALLSLLGPNASFDILFIDGDHALEGVKYDFEAFRRFVRPGGFIIFDDYLDATSSPDVRPYVDSLVASFSTQNLPYEAWGIVRNVAKAPPTDGEFSRSNDFVVRVTQPKKLLSVGTAAPRVPPFFGVVTSTFKRKNGQSPFFLARLLESLKQQTFDSFVVYVVGDAYGDAGELEQIVRRAGLGSKAVVVDMPLPGERDRGLPTLNLWRIGGSSAMNVASSLALVTGHPWILHLDDDEWWPATRLERLYGLLHASPGAVFASTAYQFQPKDNSSLPRGWQEMRGAYPGNFVPEEGNIIHSSMCLHFDLAKDFRYPGFLGNDVVEYRTGDSSLISYVKKRLLERNDWYAILLPELLGFRDSEAAMLNGGG